MSVDLPADDDSEPGSESGLEIVESASVPPDVELNDNVVAGEQSASTEPDFPHAAAEALRPIQQLIEQAVLANAAGQSALAAQQEIAHAAQDAARIGQAIADSPAVRVAEDLEVQRRKFAQLGADVANLTARISGPSSLIATLAQIQVQHSEQAQRMADAVKLAIDGIWPWIKKAAKATGEKTAELYRRAAPPNWTDDPASAVADYSKAVRLALEEGIPLAWVPDQQTVKLLLAVPGSGPSRRAQLNTILDDRREIVIVYCEARLREIADSSTVTPQLREATQVAVQAVEAFRLGLDAPAQSAASNLIDLLLRNASTTVYGNYQHKTVPERVRNLSSQANRAGLPFFGILRELATMMPVLTAMEPWYPNRGAEPPKTFSRHVVTHHITAPGQVTRTNALIAVMTAISLLSQQHSSCWNAWRMLATLEASRGDRTTRT